MSWIKLCIFTLGWLICASPATAGKITQFTDSEGTVHITNSGPDDHAPARSPENPAQVAPDHKSLRLSHLAAAAHPALSVSKA